MNSPLEYPRISRLIDTDASVSENYQRIVSATIAGIYSGSFDNSTVQEFRDYYIGQVRESMRRVFDSLLLRSPGDPLQAGTFLFEKGVSRDFPYKNLSGGEKAAFDLLLDLIMKRLVYDDTVFCIDEPDLHMHTRLQARLLAELYSLIPDNCQLWLATHSIGMMKESRDLQARNPESVAFLDFHNLDLDQPVTLRPVRANRQFWLTNLDVALGDMASLLAPRRVILCEGQLASAGTSAKAEFDAKCYRTIFGHEYPDVDFLSIGSSNDVEIDKLGLGAAIQTLVPGTEVIRLVDRDDRSPQEIVDLLGKGVRVLSRRHIEAYLLDDEVITKLCEVQAKSDKLQDALNARQVAIADSVTSGKPDDDIKSAAGPLTVSLKKLLQLTGAGNTQDAFLRDTMAPLVPQCPGVYNALKRDVFGD